MTIAEYLNQINARLAEGHTSEHTFRADLEALIKTLLPDFHVTNEPSKITDCGNPDYVITKNSVPIGYIEAKDIGKDLNHKQYKEQFTRYRNALDNLIITDYVWFQFFENGEKVAEVWLGKKSESTGQIIPLEKEFIKFENLIQEFSTKVTQAIKSPVKLAELMAGKARLLENILEEALTADLENQIQSPLTDQYTTFQQMLIHDLQPKQFADLYAQTLAYGMFAARYHDPTLPTFDRDEAARLIPQSNPLLRNLFQSIAGYNIDERIKTTVDNLAEVFRHADVKNILEGYGKKTAQTDPIIHFYETFLAKYDAKLRKARGVWYTPQPVVNFIVRAVDDILKTKFGIKDGLADNSKTTIEVEASTDMQAQGSKLSKRKGKLYGTKEVHKVQILDPATGTGTFLAEVVNHLYHSKFKHMQGIWPSYVENDLIPRLNGFELLMASYAMAHLKLDMLLGETGCATRDQNNRLRIFLTNSLEEYHPDTHSLFASWLSNEAKEANAVKKDTPVMVVMGNPPYSVSSSNKGEWIQNLVQDYKKDLNERNIQPLSDDYIKFIRYGQHFIEQNGEGVLAFITNNSFIDGLIHRQMRKNLLETFDEIYILDLHGNSKKKETAPDGSKDENVFDIMQGVAISLLVKDGSKIKKKGDLGQVFKSDLFGKRKKKYHDLSSLELNNTNWELINSQSPSYLFINQDLKSKEIYEKNLSINTLFRKNSLGIEFGSKSFFLQKSKSELQKFLTEVIFNKEIGLKEIETTYKIKTTSGWRFSELLDKERLSGFLDTKITLCDNSPFDKQYTYFSEILRRPQLENLKHLTAKNVALLTLRQSRADDISVFLSANTYSKDAISMLDRVTGFQLYLYPEDQSKRIPNLNPEEIKAFEKALKLPFVAENPEQSFVPSCLLSEQPGEFTPIDMLDYIYAVLHSPTYRETYKEFLKTDFPRVPYPDPKTFWNLVKLGDEIRLLHLMESPALDKLITSYPQAGDNIVSRKITKTSPGWQATSDTHGKVWINDDQYFDDVPLKAWEFYIGGYQPAQKWLKDRQGRELSFDDILHYQKIIVALVETSRIMLEVDDVLYQKDKNHAE